MFRIEVILRRISPLTTAGEFALFGDVIEVAAVDAVRNINEGTWSVITISQNCPR